KWYEFAEQQRKICGLTQVELGDKLNVEQGTVGNWLNGRREPELATILKIFHALGITQVTFNSDSQIVDIQSKQRIHWYELAEQRRKNLGLSQAELADEFEVSQATVGNWLSNRREADIYTIAKLLERLGIVDVVLHTDATISLTSGIFDTNTPQLKVSAALKFRGQDIGEKLTLEDELSLHYFSQDVRAYAVRIDGEKLEPRIVSGEYIVVEPGAKLQSYDEVLIKLKDGRYMIRVLLTGRNKEWRYADPNTMQQDTDFDPSQIETMEYIAAIIKPPR
ncbi:TPA: helix-turn-helix domain-containing protein, partial [Mannheimia haemolytica]|nr:helix-turn-helix domain-containing protein [Mannheimia haemolytica]